MQEKQQNMLKKLKSFWLLIIGVITGLAALISQLEKIQENTDSIIGFGKYLFPIFVIVICYIVYTDKVTVGQAFGKPVSRKRYGPKQRKFALTGLVLSSILFVIAIGWHPIRSITGNSNDTNILITKFNGPDQGDLGIRENIYSSLEDLRKTYPDIHPVESDEVIKSSSEAQSLGKKEGADIVIWGWARKQNNSIQVKATYEPIGENDTDVIELRSPMQPVSLEENDEFQLNIEISADSAYLTSSILGFSHYLSGKYTSAIAGFEEALIQAEYSSSNDYIDRGLIHGYLGNLYVSTQQYEKAISSYTEALRDNPSDFIVYLNIAKTYALRGEYGNSLEIYDLAIESLYSTNVDEPPPYCGCKAYTGRGFTHLSVGQFEEAIEDFKQALALDSAYIDAKQGLVIAYLVTENYLDAHHSVDSLIQQTPDDSEAMNYKGLIFQAEGKYAEALELYNKALELSDKTNPNVLFNRSRLYLRNGEIDNAITDLKKGTTLTPDNSTIWSVLGLAYSSNSNWEQAIESFKQAILLNEESHKDYNLLATVYRYTGNHDEAIEILQDSIAIDPNFYLSHKNLAILYEDIFSKNTSQAEQIAVHYEKAIQILDEINELDDSNGVSVTACELDFVSQANCRLQFLPRSEELIQVDMFGDLYVNDLEKEQEEISESLSATYRRLGDIEYYDNQNPEEALLLYQKAIETWDKNSLALLRRGSSYSDVEKYSSAMEDLNKAITIGFGNRHTLAEAYVIRANIHNSTGDYDNAIEDVNTALDLWTSSDNARAWIVRGIAYRNQKKYQVALKDFELAVRIEPDSSLAYFHKAETLRRHQKYQDAADNFSSAIAVNADYDLAYYHRGLTYQDMGNFEEAISDFEKAIEITNNSQLKERVQDALRKVESDATSP